MKNNELKLIRELEKEVSNYYEKAQAFIDSNSKNYRGVFYKKSIDKYGITLDGVKGVVRHTAVTCPNKANTLLFATAWAMLAQEVYNLDKEEGKPTYLAWARHYGYLNSASTTVAKTTSKNIDKPKQTSHSKVRRINTLNGYSWEEVYKICKRGDACRYFKKGDKATILLNTMKSMSNDKATYGKVKTLPSQFATVTVMGIGYFTLYLFISAYEEEIL